MRRPVGSFPVALGLVLACASLSLAQVRSPAAESKKLEPLTWGSVERMHKLGGIYLASQPSKEDFELARESGIKTVINLRKKEELGWDERGVVEKLGMEYHAFGFKAPEELTDDVFDSVRRLLIDAQKQPVLVHCSSANRVAAVWLAHRVLDDHLTFDEAFQEAGTVGLTLQAFAEKARGYVARRTPK